MSILTREAANRKSEAGRPRKGSEMWKNLKTSANRERILDDTDLMKRMDRSERRQQEAESDILRPSVAILCALSSIAVHAEEFLSPTGHHFDLSALRTTLAQPEIVAWIAAMTKAGFAPVKR